MSDFQFNPNSRYVGDRPRPKASQDVTSGSYWADTAKGFVGGIGKEIGSQMTEGEGEHGSLFGAEHGYFPQVGRAVRDWSHSRDAGSPTAEAAGRFATDVAPGFMVPELGVATGAMRALNAGKMLNPVLRHPGIARNVFGVGENVGRGAVGGMTQSPDAEGAGTGAATGAAQSVAGPVMRAVSRVVPGAAVAGDIMNWTGGHGAHLPYWALYHLPSQLQGLARAFYNMSSGGAGATAERLRQSAPASTPPRRTLVRDKDNGDQTQGN